MFAIPASSTTTVAPAHSAHSGAGPPARRCWWRNLASVVASIPAAAANTSAAFPDGARPTTGRRWATSPAAPARTAVVFPAPAGPTTSTRRPCPLIASATARCRSTSAGTRAGSTSRVAQSMSLPSWSSTAVVVRYRSVTCSLIRLDAVMLVSPALHQLRELRGDLLRSGREQLARLDPGGWVPRHVHARQDERVEVLAGTLTVRVGRTERTPEVGDSAGVPRRRLHVVGNDGDGEARFLPEVRPAHRMEAAQRGLFGVMRLVSPLAARDPRAVSHRATPRHKYGCLRGREVDDVA